jgi:hypothetical protein
MEEEKVVEQNQQPAPVEQKPEVKEKKKPSGIGKFFKFIFNTIITLAVIAILLNTVIGVLDMQKLNNGEDPLWYTDVETTNDNGGTKTTYKIGLYVVEKVQDGQSTKMMLKPFFLK